MPGINTLLLSTGALGSFTCSGMTLPMYMGPTTKSQVFTPYNFGSSRDQTPDLLTTRPTCYHSATALLINPWVNNSGTQSDNIRWQLTHISGSKFKHPWYHSWTSLGRSIARLVYNVGGGGGGRRLIL